MKTKHFVLGLAVIAFTACNKPTTETGSTDAAAPDHTATDSAEVTPAPKLDSAAMMKAWQDYMTPGDVHKMIAGWDGEWDEEVTMWMDPAAPPTVSKATVSNKMIFNGLYQDSRHKGTMMGMPFEGISTMAYNKARNMFESTWIDNMGSGIMYTEGTWDEAGKSIHTKGRQTEPGTGRELEIRQVTRIIDQDHQIMEMFCTPKGEKEVKSMEIKMSRKKG